MRRQLALAEHESRRILKAHARPDHRLQRSDPWRIAQAGDPLLADSVLRQLRAADLVLLNKTDLVSASELAEVRAWLEGVIGGAPVFETVAARVSPILLGGLALSPADGGRAAGNLGHDDYHDHDHAQEHEHHHDHDHDAGSPDHPAQFDTWSSRPAGILRAADLRRSLRRADAVPAAGLPALVAIGLHGRLPVSALAAVFVAAALDADDGQNPTG